MEPEPVPPPERLEAVCRKRKPTMKTWPERYAKIEGRSLNFYATRTDKIPRGSSIRDVAGCDVQSTETENFTLGEPRSWYLIKLERRGVMGHPDLDDSGISKFCFEEEAVRDTFAAALRRLSAQPPLQAVDAPRAAVWSYGGCNCQCEWMYGDAGTDFTRGLAEKNRMRWGSDELDQMAAKLRTMERDGESRPISVRLKGEGTIYRMETVSEAASFVEDVAQSCQQALEREAARGDLDAAECEWAWHGLCCEDSGPLKAIALVLRSKRHRGQGHMPVDVRIKRKSGRRCFATPDAAADWLEQLASITLARRQNRQNQQQPEPEPELAPEDPSEEGVPPEPLRRTEGDFERAAARADPHWCVAAEPPTCMLCHKTEFTWSERMNPTERMIDNCRYCGWVVCSACMQGATGVLTLAVDRWVSSQGDHAVQFLSGGKTKDKRVCRSCYEHAPQDMAFRREGSSGRVAELPAVQLQMAAQTARLAAEEAEISHQASTERHEAELAAAKAMAAEAVETEHQKHALLHQGEQEHALDDQRRLLEHDKEARSGIRLRIPSEGEGTYVGFKKRSALQANLHLIRFETAAGPLTREIKLKGIEWKVIAASADVRPQWEREKAKDSWVAYPMHINADLEREQHRWEEIVFRCDWPTAGALPEPEPEPRWE
jgi:hypothetical protein